MRTPVFVDNFLCINAPFLAIMQSNYTVMHSALRLLPQGARCLSLRFFCADFKPVAVKKIALYPAFGIDKIALKVFFNKYVNFA